MKTPEKNNRKENQPKKQEPIPLKQKKNNLKKDLNRDDDDINGIHPASYVDERNMPDPNKVTRT